MVAEDSMETGQAAQIVTREIASVPTLVHTMHTYKRSIVKCIKRQTLLHNSCAVCGEVKVKV